MELFAEYTINTGVTGYVAYSCDTGFRGDFCFDGVYHIAEIGMRYGDIERKLAIRGNDPCVPDGGSGKWYAIMPRCAFGDPCDIPSTQSATAAAASTSLPPATARESDGQLAAQQEDVCARVRLELEQQAVVARSAISAELGLDNSSSSPLSMLQARVQVFDLAGNLVNDRFQIRVERLSNFTAVDGTGTLAGRNLGSARWVIVPTDAAAPTGPTQYLVGGYLAYEQNGLMVAVPIQAVQVTILPNPALTLHYFHQRDVFADDPFTEVIEPSQPYSLAVLIANDGGPNLLEGANVTIRQLSETLYRVEGLDELTDPSGGYAFRVFADGVTSVGGTRGIGNYQLTWVNRVATPLAATEVRFTPDNGLSSTDNRTNTLTGSVVGTSPQSDVTVSVFDLTVNRELGRGIVVGNQFTVPVTLDQAGARRLRVRVTDTAGNFADTEFNLFVDLIAPAVERISGTPLQSRREPVGDVFVRFSERIDPATFTLDDLTLTRDGVDNLHSDGSGVAIAGTADPFQYVIRGLGRRADQPGLYELVLNMTGVTDEVGNAGLSRATARWALLAPGVPDTTPPTSQVRVLPAASGENFVISWAGEDNEGIAGYDIYVSVNQGPYTKWLSNTPLTSAVYEALPGQTLAFYSVARDFAGNSEPATPPENPPVTSIPQRGGITGVLFHDRNADGLRQLNEEGLADWVVFLDTDEDRLPDADEVRATTDADGSYRFENLPAGDYQVVPITPAGWRASERLTTTASSTTVQTAFATSPTGSSIWADLIGLTKLATDSAYAGLRGAGSVVAVLDTGFAADARSLVSNPIVYQYDFVDNDTDAHDPNGHGTVVTRLISTVAPESSLIILRVLDASGRGTFATVERTLQWLVVHGPSFGLTAVNLSFSDAAGYDLAASRHGLGDELAALANQGVLVVAAAGNNQYRTPGVAYPAADPSVLAVGAVWPGAVGSAAWPSGAKDHSTTADQIVSFSQRSKNITISSF